MAQKQALGKGLASLFPGMAPGVPLESLAPVASAPLPESANRIPGITFAIVDDIQANPFQPRREFVAQELEELAQSIRINGVIQPLVVRKGPSGGYQLIAGERRLRASKLAGLRQVPVVVRRSTDKEALELALIENIQRSDLNCVDEALAYFQLVQEFSLTQEEVATRVGKERSTVANYLRLLQLPEPILDDLKRSILSFGHGKALLGIEDPELRLQARAEVVQKRLSVRATELLVEQVRHHAMTSIPPQAENTPTTTPLIERLKNLSQELSRKWSTKVDVKGSEKRGKITIHYATRQELDRILDSMQR